MSINIYALRRAILADFKRYFDVPVTATELMELSLNLSIRAHYDAAVTECVELRLMGYLETYPEFGGQYLRITEKGLEQLNPEYRRDLFIHGPGALSRGV